jgi:hypothetical protein
MMARAGGAPTTAVPASPAAPLAKKVCAQETPPMDGGGEGRRKLGRKPLTPMVTLGDDEVGYR